MKKLNIQIYNYHFQEIASFGIFSNLKYYECELDIGIRNDEKKRSDRFSLIVCNLDGLNKVFSEDVNYYGFVDINHIMIVKEFKKATVIELLRKRIEAVEGESWSDIVEKLCVFLNYEFSPNIPQWEQLLGE